MVGLCFGLSSISNFFGFCFLLIIPLNNQVLCIIKSLSLEENSSISFIDMLLVIFTML